MKEYEQLDMFGSAVPLDTILLQQKPTKRKYKTMQQLYGTINNKICKQCAHLMRHNYNRKHYNKCELWHVSHSSATDIRVKDRACGKYEEGAEQHD